MTYYECAALQDAHDPSVRPCPNLAMYGKAWCPEHLAMLIAHRDEIGLPVPRRSPDPDSAK